MTRQEINKEILALLSEYNDKNPDQRFGQILVNLKVIMNDSGMEFYTESKTMLNRIKNQLYIQKQENSTEE